MMYYMSICLSPEQRHSAKRFVFVQRNEKGQLNTKKKKERLAHCKHIANTAFSRAHLTHTVDGKNRYKFMLTVRDITVLICGIFLPGGYR